MDELPPAIAEALLAAFHQPDVASLLSPIQQGPFYSGQIRNPGEDATSSTETDETSISISADASSCAEVSSTAVEGKMYSGQFETARRLIYEVLSAATNVRKLRAERDAVGARVLRFAHMELSRIDEALREQLAHEIESKMELLSRTTIPKVGVAAANTVAGAVPVAERELVTRAEALLDKLRLCSEFDAQLRACSNDKTPDALNVAARAADLLALQTVSAAAEPSPYSSSCNSLDGLVEKSDRDHVEADASLLAQLERQLALALSLFHVRLDSLDQMWNAGTRTLLPWQLRFAADSDPSSEQVVRFEGGRIIDSDGNDIWEEICQCCSRQIQAGAIGYGKIRWRCVDGPGAIVLCEWCFCWRGCVRVLELSSFGSNRLEKSFYTDLHDSTFVSEHTHPVFLRFGNIPAPGYAGANSLSEALFRTLCAYGGRPLFVERSAMAASSTMRRLTYRQVRRDAIAMAHAMLSVLHLAPRTFSGILMAKRSEWYVSDFASVFCSLSPVGLHHTWSEDDLVYILDQTEMACIFVDSQNFTRVMNAARRSCYLRQIVVVDDMNIREDHFIAHYGSPSLTSGCAVSVWSWEALKSQGQQRVNGLTNLCSRQQLWNAVDRTSDADSTFSIMFTSGSTGRPKGAIVNQSAWIRDIDHAEFKSPLVVLSWLPSALGSDRQIVWNTIFNGGIVALSRFGTIGGMLEDAPSASPTHIFGPPMLWNELYHNFCVRLAQRQSVLGDVFCATARDDVLAQVSGMLGSRIRALSTGGAHTSAAVVAFCRECFCRKPGVRFDEGYGTTEVGGISSNGEIDTTVEVRLEAVDELGYYPDADPPRGQICVKSPITVPGYFKNIIETEKSFTTDGFFRTGDIGEFTPTGDLVVLDRLKNYFKLTTGEFVSPERLEAIYDRSEFVAKTCLVGSSAYPRIVALVSCMSDCSPADILAQLTMLSRLHDLRPCEVPAAVIIDNSKWTAATHELTPSLKLNRIFLRHKHHASIVRALEALDASQLYQGTELTLYQTTADAPINSLLSDLVRSVVGGSLPLDNFFDQSLIELGADSMAIVRFVLGIRQELGHKVAHISTYFFSHAALATVADAIAPFLSVHMVEGASVTATVASNMNNVEVWSAQQNQHNVGLLRADIELYEHEILSSERHTSSCAPQSVAILLTGSTGFLGRFLLAHLLQHCPRKLADVVIFCIVRAQSNQAATSRIECALDEIGALRSLASRVKFRRNVRCLAGDLALVRCGLSSQHWKDITGQVTLIFHAAANTSFVSSYAELRAPNVIATSNLLKLAREIDAVFIHVSTLSVFGSGPGLLMETDSSASLNSIASAGGYVASKWVAEQLVFRSGVRYRVIRPGFLWFSSGLFGVTYAGISNPNDWTTRLISSACEIGALPDFPRGLLSVSAVDDCAAGILRAGEVFWSVVESSRASESVARNQHLQSVSTVLHIGGSMAHAISLTQITAWLNDALQTVHVEKIPVADWFSRILTKGSSSAMPLVPLLERGIPPVVPASCAQFESVLEIYEGEPWNNSGTGLSSHWPYRKRDGSPSAVGSFGRTEFVAFVCHLLKESEPQTTYAGGTKNVLVLGLNPALQKTLVFPSGVEIDRINRASEVKLSVGGKGQHSALAMAAWPSSEHLKIYLAHFVAGEVGQSVCRMLEGRGIRQLSVQCQSGATRTCTTLLDCRSNPAVMTELIEPSPVVDLHNIMAMSRAVSSQGSISAVALCGTPPAGVPDKYCSDLLQNLPLTKAAWVLLDGCKDARQILESGRVNVLKVNELELSLIADECSQTDAVKICRSLVGSEKQCAQMAADIAANFASLRLIGVTRGSKCAILLSRDCSKLVIDTVAIPQVSTPDSSIPLNPVGAGDTVSGVFLAELLHGTDPPLAFARGISAASASLLSLIGAQYDVRLAQRFCEQAKISRAFVYPEH